MGHTNVSQASTPNLNVRGDFARRIPPRTCLAALRALIVVHGLSSNSRTSPLRAKYLCFFAHRNKPIAQRVKWMETRRSVLIPNVQLLPTLLLLHLHSLFHSS
jgi:hypothetical protein